MATTRLMPLHIGKGQTAGDAIKRALGYIKDPMKTENGILVTSYGCTPQTAEAEFMLMRREYLTITGRRRGKDDVLATLERLLPICCTAAKASMDRPCLPAIHFLLLTRR